MYRSSIHGFVVGVCFINPCRNGGVCTVLTPTTFSCDCPTGFTGSQCEVDMDVRALIPLVSMVVLVLKGLVLTLHASVILIH